VPASVSAVTPLTIGIDARAASDELAGRGRLVRELLRALSARDDPHTYRLYARHAWAALDERFSWVTVEERDPLWHVITARQASRECDVFLSTNSYLTAWFTTVPTVLVVCDMVAFDRALRPKLRSALIERLTLGIATRRSRAFLAISAATADELVKRFPRCASSTVVALLGATRGPEPAGPGPEPAPNAKRPTDAVPPDGFVLAVGTLEPRKNLPRLVAAFARLAPALQASHPLVVVGASGWSTGETMRALRSLGDRARVVGYVSDTELWELYRRCTVFCYPSLAEGFGLPVLEAMAAGAAVVTSNVSSLPEVGGDAVEYADPLDVDAIADALRKVIEDTQLRDQLRARAKQRAGEFTWAGFAQTTREVLEHAAAIHTSPSRWSRNNR
jgi:glycosyltransferase involved in cell wall biosynthesis